MSTMKTINTATVTSGNAPWSQHIETAGHRLVADEPESAGGRDTGPAPYDLLLASLGACTSMTLQMYAARKGWDIGGVQVHLTLSKNAEGETRIDRTIALERELGDEQWERLIEIAGKTPVTKTLLAGVAIETRPGPRSTEHLTSPPPPSDHRS